MHDQRLLKEAILKMMQIQLVNQLELIVRSKSKFDNIVLLIYLIEFFF